jgi:uncharacterized protein (TIGR03435 family)
VGRAVAIVSLASLISLSPQRTYAQSEPARLALDVASVKPNRSGEPRGFVRTKADHLTGKNVTLKQLMAHAYGLRGYQVSARDWIESEGYDVSAMAKNSPSVPQFRLMLRSLLEDRFKPKTHRETKEIPVYWRVVAEGGPKLRDVKEEESFKSAHAGKSPFRPGLMAIFNNKSLPEFALRLGLDCPVIDKTGIEGRFWFQLEWAEEPVQTGREPLIVCAGPSLLTALEEQLGLKLEEHRAPTEILIIDRAERPSEN